MQFHKSQISRLLRKSKKILQMTSLKRNSKMKPLRR